MKKRIRITLLILVLIQGLHSIEEYIGRFWEVFPPAKLLGSYVSIDFEAGFVIFNITLFVFGLWCWLLTVLKNYLIATYLIWFWVVIELINGIGHPLWAFYKGAYVPGLATSPILLILAVYLFKQLLHPDAKSGNIHILHQLGDSSLRSE